MVFMFSILIYGKNMYLQMIQKLPEGYQNTTGYFTSYTLSGSAALLLNTDIFEELGT